MAACCPSAWERGIKLEPSFSVNSTARRCDNTQSHRGTTWDLRVSSPCLQLSNRQPETSFCHRTVLSCLGERCCCKRLATCKWGPRSHRLQQPLAQTLARFLPRCFMFLRDADHNRSKRSIGHLMQKPSTRKARNTSDTKTETKPTNIQQEHCPWTQPFVGLHSESHHARQQCSQLKPKKMRCAVPKRDLGISWFCGCDHSRNTLCTI